MSSIEVAMIQRYKPSRPNVNPETDERFPSGTWTGFFVQQEIYYGRCWMDIFLRFSNGIVKGEWHDIVGPFVMRGKYELDSAVVSIHKDYIEANHVYYKGRHKGKAISGIWHLPSMRGPFIIWHEKNADPTIRRLRAEAEVPVEEVILVS